MRPVSLNILKSSRVRKNSPMKQKAYSKKRFLNTNKPLVLSNVELLGQ
ncbi:hypothetical protein CY0110_18002 [Crocosphaera chwakensis CCY0110]|uniref:Uncharacterized protein n=1 Tax=Crocosphaera chwakensis CCY0110 TaxID=391612 RepID=A3IIT2_9CHRO|nr:hypothetical protein CY0110_18002 [Crocosphaera chwakensis CCY0110]